MERARVLPVGFFPCVSLGPIPMLSGQGDRLNFQNRTCFMSRKTDCSEHTEEQAGWQRERPGTARRFVP